MMKMILILKTELGKQIAEEDELNEKIRQNLSQIIPAESKL
jgi:hypothetical protein